MAKIAAFSPLLIVLVLALLITIASAASNATSSHSSTKNSKNSSHKKAAKASNNDSKNTTSTSSSSSKKSKTSTAAKGPDLVGDSSDKNFTLNNLPKTWQTGQSGTNQCNQWGQSSQTSMCQNAFFNALDDFCLWAPPTPGTIGDTERIEVSWCMKQGYGTRLIPAGAIEAAHFIQTKEYVQITGTGDLTLINIPAGDSGGELDPHGADGNGNPIGGLVFSNAFDNGKYRQIHEWMLFVSDSVFCFRACKGRDKTAQNLCQHIYDTMGCNWVMPGNYAAGFDSCDADVALPPGIVGTSTFTQGDAVTPSASPAPSSSKCTTTKTLQAQITVSTTATAVGASSSSAGSGTGSGAALAASGSSGSTSSSSSSIASGVQGVRPMLALTSISALVAASLYIF